MRKPFKTKKDKQTFDYKKLDKELVWFDATSQTGWCSLEDMENAKPAVANTSNMWIFKETKEYITLFGTYSYDEQGKIEFGEIITIPKRWM